MLIMTIELIFAVTACFLTCLYGEYQERMHRPETGVGSEEISLQAEFLQDLAISIW